LCPDLAFINGIAGKYLIFAHNYHIEWRGLSI
jgi:hypothetical protein